MAESRPDRSALAGHLRACASPVVDADCDVVLSERWPLAILQIDRLPGSLVDRFNVEQLLGTRTLFPVGPDRWFVVDNRDQLETLNASLAHAAAMGFAVTDLSHGRTVLRISGRKARDVLAKGCALDLHPGVFPGGACAATSVAGVAAVLIVVDNASTYDLYVPRTYGQYVWEWLYEAAAEYGHPAASG
jgi:sarcosine oxidase, subunit gamma